MLNYKLKLIMLVLSIVLIIATVACADPIDIHNDSFRTIIEELQGRITALESAGSGVSHLIYPQQWATGDGTESNSWANNCIQKAYDFVPAGGTIFLKAGYYTLSDSIRIEKQVNIIGEGMSKTIIKTANDYGFEIYADYVTFKGFTVDGDAQTDGTQWLSPIFINNADYTLLKDIEVKNAGYYGMGMFEHNHCVFQNIYAHDNYRHGLHPGADTAGKNMHNIYRDIYAWNNGNSGFADNGNAGDPEGQAYNVFDNIQCWDNGNYNIMIGWQGSGVLSNSFASGSGNKGICLYNLKDFNVHDCSTTLNTNQGIYIESSNNVNFTNVIVKNNNAHGTLIHNGSGIKFTSCQSYDDREILIQTYGVALSGTASEISLINCKLIPNKNGNIYNPDGVVIIQWPSDGDDANLAQLTADFNALKTEYDALLLRIKTASEAVNE